jgi:hypothetical protein
METAGGRDGGDGWMRVENVGRGGDGGQGATTGATTGYVVVPPSSRQRRGGRMAHMCLLLPTPSRSRNIVDGGRCESHTPPPFDFVYPPCGGCSFPASLTTTGAACNLHAAPFYFFSSPLVGGCPFSPASCDPHTVSVSLRLPPRHWGGFFPPL